MCCSTPGFPVVHRLLDVHQRPTSKLMSVSVVPPTHPLSSPSPAFSLPQPASMCFLVTQLFASGGQSIGASASVSPSSEYSGLISFRIDWFDLLAVQGILKSLLQHHSSKASILRRSAFIAQLLHPYMTWKNYSFDCMGICRWSNPLLFNKLSRFVIAFLPRWWWWCSHSSHVQLLGPHGL